MKPGACWLSAVSGGAGLKRILLSVAIGIFTAACSTTGHSVEKLYGPKNASKVERKGSAQMCLLVALAPADSPVWKEKSDAKIEKLKQDLRASESGQLAGRNNARFLNGGNLDFDDEGNLLAGTGDESGNAAADTFTACLLKFGWGWEKPGQSRATPPVREAKKETPYRTIETDSRVPVGGITFYWLDDQRVLFLGDPQTGEYCEFKSGKSSGMVRRDMYRFGIYDLRNGLSDWVGELGGGDSCHDGSGGLYEWPEWYDWKNCNKPKASDPRKPLRARFEAGIPGIPQGQSYAISACTPSDPPEPAWMAAARKSGREIRPLRHGHGWVEMKRVGPDGTPLPPSTARDRGPGARMQAEYPYRIYRPGAEDEDGIAVDDVFRAAVAESGRGAIVHFAPFRNAYFVSSQFEFSYEPSAGKTFSLWWMQLDGKVEKIMTVRSDGVMGKVGRSFTIPARSGVFFRDNGGLYRYVSGDRRELAAEGPMNVPYYPLSPNGCRFVFGQRNSDSRSPEPPQLRIVNLCQGEQP